VRGGEGGREEGREEGRGREREKRTERERAWRQCCQEGGRYQVRELSHVVRE
jgi:hypothetical protein